MREPKIPPMKIKVQHTVRIKGLNRTFFWGVCAYTAVHMINQQLNKMTREHESTIVDAAERFGEKVGDEDLANRVKDVFNNADTKKDNTE